MKRNHKTWIQQLSEAYVRQALNEFESPKNEREDEEKSLSSLEKPKKESPLSATAQSEVARQRDNERHSEELQAHLDDAEQHRGPSGVSDAAIPSLTAAHRLISAGGIGSYNQLDRLSDMVGQLDIRSLHKDHPLRARHPQRPAEERHRLF